jgi:superfamily II DNA or RNA helicase
LKRKHQIEFEQIDDNIISGSFINKIIAKVTPGGGKSALPIIAGKLIKAGFADALCWVVPRQSLQNQGEHNFIDPFFRNMFDHKMIIRASTNDENPCRGLSGFITTYQAIGVCNSCLDFVFKRNRMILILDEFHHVEHEGTWFKALKSLVNDAAYLLLMTGTLERGDGKKIAFIKYDEIGNGYKPDMQPDNETAIIEYSRRDALAEKAIIPLSFHLSDGHAEWVDIDGFERECDIKKAPKNIASQALFTALSTGFADELLSAGLQHWQEIKKYNPKSKLLVVTSNYNLAKKTARSLLAMGLKSDIATSHESDQAQKAIKDFKSDRLDILVTIAMGYEGLDVPDITHIICLTNIRSTPWIEQMVARAVRIQNSIPYESQVGYIFAPDDVFFREIVKKIEKEQLPFVQKVSKMEGGPQLPLFPSEKTENAFQIQPIGSNLSGHREIFVGEKMQDDIDVTYKSISDQRDLAPSEIEKDLRQKIQKCVNKYCFDYGFEHEKINHDIKEKFGKGRKMMTIDELKKVYYWIQTEFVRGGGLNYYALD